MRGVLSRQNLRSCLTALSWRVVFGQLSCRAELEAYLRGRTALEIGGPSAVFGRFGLLPVYQLAASVDNCNFARRTVWEGAVMAGLTFRFNRRRPLGRQYIAEAADLTFIPHSTYDVVISSHTLEHVANPLKALNEWVRVLNTNGLLILVLPHRDGTFDHRRPMTTIEHLLEDLKNDVGEEDLTHLEEILALHDLARDPRAGDFSAFAHRSKRNVENRCLHHHVFDTRLAIEVVHHVGLQILAVEVVRPYHIFLVARKQPASETLDNERFQDIRCVPAWSSPFPSDRPDVADQFCPHTEQLIPAVETEAHGFMQH
jgi:SAM-dependent methyltransferase